MGMGFVFWFCNWFLFGVFGRVKSSERVIVSREHVMSFFFFFSKTKGLFGKKFIII